MTIDDLWSRLFLIAGPCVIESREHCLFMAKELKQMADMNGMPYIFKASYDKANRSSVHSPRGPGLQEGLEILAEVKATIGVPVTSDVHDVSEVGAAGEVLDVIQIPAFLCRQTDLVVAAAMTGKIVNVKKGQFLAPQDMKNVVDKILSVDNDRILLTERGTTFGYNNLVVDFRSFWTMRHEIGFPVVYDVTHSLQLPGYNGTSSSGQDWFIPSMAKAAVAAGVNGLFMEVHDNPPKALSDGPNSANLRIMSGLLEQLARIRRAIL